MKLLCTIAVFMLIFITESFCDQRNFIWTYEYMIMDTSAAEIEQYTTLSSTDADKMEGTTSTELNFEVEVGMNKHYDFAIYQNFKQTPDGSLKYSGFKLRTRYLFGEKNKYFMDPLLYLEYKGKPDFSEHGIEMKLILEKDFGNFRLSLNPYFEYEIAKDESEFVPKYAIGLGYRLGRLFHVGIESKGDKKGSYIGPTIAHGSHRFWIALGALKNIGAVSEGASEFQLRMIIGLHL
ncbi:MAG: hypothetical protein HW421_1505 [Ignavibacteria bacterium]|nr:hypothetical protein [Ignavibacteria bacterium]